MAYLIRRNSPFSPFSEFSDAEILLLPLRGRKFGGFSGDMPCLSSPYSEGTSVGLVTWRLGRMTGATWCESRGRHGTLYLHSSLVRDARGRPASYWPPFGGGAVPRLHATL